MSNDQKTLRIFGILELVSFALYVFNALQGAGMEWGNAAFALAAAVSLLQAAKDSSKIMPAWVITLGEVILSVLSIILALTGDNDLILVEGITLVINLIAFIAANNIKKRVRR